MLLLIHYVISNQVPEVCVMKYMNYIYITAERLIGIYMGKTEGSDTVKKRKMYSV